MPFWGPWPDCTPRELAEQICDCLHDAVQLYPSAPSDRTMLIASCRMVLTECICQMEDPDLAGQLQRFALKGKFYACN